MVSGLIPVAPISSTPWLAIEAWMKLAAGAWPIAAIEVGSERHSIAPAMTI
jgi:hypothetical protein